ncbi:hypothetical protein U9R90_30610 [Streptomyces sp. E11-3]
MTQTCTPRPWWRAPDVRSDEKYDEEHDVRAVDSPHPHLTKQ